MKNDNIETKPGGMNFLVKMNLFNINTVKIKLKIFSKILNLWS